MDAIFLVYPRTGSSAREALRLKTTKEDSLGVRFLQQGRPELITMATLHEGESSVNRWQSVVDEDLHPRAAPP